MFKKIYFQILNTGRKEKKGLLIETLKFLDNNMCL
jgi:hypothetical protein